eukprot:826786-Prymnesium_polylepis.1
MPSGIPEASSIDGNAIGGGEGEGRLSEGERARPTTRGVTGAGARGLAALMPEALGREKDVWTMGLGVGGGGVTTLATPGATELCTPSAGDAAASVSTMWDNELDACVAAACILASNSSDV